MLTRASVAPLIVGRRVLPEWVGKEGNYDLTGKVEAAPYRPDLSTISMLVFGQSNSINIAGDLSFVPVAGTENFNPQNGKNYVAKDPLLGCENGGGNGAHGTPGAAWATRLGSSMVAAGMAQRVVITNVGTGATTMDDWLTGKVAGRLRYAVCALQQAGLEPNVVLQMQGESDSLAATSSANYAAKVRALVASDLRYVGCSAPYFVGRTAHITGATAPNIAAVRQGQVEACSDSLGIFLGADSDALTGANRYPDGTHLNDLGIVNHAAQWLAVLQAHWAAS